MIRIINASVMPEDVTGYHQRLEYDTEAGVCHEYRLGCSTDSMGVHETEPMNDADWAVRCERFRRFFTDLHASHPDATLHLDIEGEIVL